MVRALLFTAGMGQTGFNHVAREEAPNEETFDVGGNDDLYLRIFRR